MDVLKEILEDHEKRLNGLVVVVKQHATWLGMLLAKTEQHEKDLNKLIEDKQKEKTK